MTEEEKTALALEIAKKTYFEYVDAQGYPNELPYWSELDDYGKSAWTGIDLGTIEIINAEYMVCKRHPL